MKIDGGHDRVWIFLAMVWSSGVNLGKFKMNKEIV